MQCPDLDRAEVDGNPRDLGRPLDRRGAFATFKGGAQDHLEPFACDGESHTYVLTAHAGSATATATQVVTSTAG